MGAHNSSQHHHQHSHVRVSFRSHGGSGSKSRKSKNSSQSDSESGQFDSAFSSSPTLDARLRRSSISEYLQQHEHDNDCPFESDSQETSPLKFYKNIAHISHGTNSKQILSFKNNPLPSSNGHNGHIISTSEASTPSSPSSVETITSSATLKTTTTTKTKSALEKKSSNIITNEPYRSHNSSDSDKSDDNDKHISSERVSTSSQKSNSAPSKKRDSSSSSHHNHHNNHHQQQQQHQPHNTPPENQKSPFSMMRCNEETIRVPPADLTEKQKASLRSSWNQISVDISQVGIIAFIGLFETHPDVQDNFLPFRGLSTTDISSSAILRAHGLRVMTTVEKCLNRMECPAKMHALMEDLGERHVAYNFKTKYIYLVGTQFVFAIRSHVDEWTPDMEDAWMTLVRIMSFYMMQGAMRKMGKETDG